MTKTLLIQRLNADLANEYLHMHFYLHHSFTVTGLHREELGEVLAEHAASEMGHVQEFGRLILGLGGVPNPPAAPAFPALTEPHAILNFALTMEEDVVRNYVDRIGDAEALGGVDGKVVELFLEKQVEHSRADVDHLREMVK